MSGGDVNLHSLSSLDLGYSEPTTIVNDKAGTSFGKKRGELRKKKKRE